MRRTTRMSELFGTDSPKGIAVAGISCELAMKAGRAAAAVLASGKNKNSKIIVAKDKNRSSDVLEAAVCAGICSAGADAEAIGVIPASAAAFLVGEHCADAGIVISAASRSPLESGIRIFNDKGIRPDEDKEKLITKLALGSSDAPELRYDGESGAILRSDDAAVRYAARLKEICPLDLSGMKIAVDCRGGCAEGIAQSLFSELGAEIAEVSEMGDTADVDFVGTPLELLMDCVAENDCDCGFAFDTDASVCIAVDENGNVIGGDALLAAFALDLRKKGTLRHNCVVAPVTSSRSLSMFLEENEIGLVTTGAADRYAAYRMREGGYNLGGESGGRILFADDMPCEDGLLTALKLLELMKNSGKSLSETAPCFEKLPQVVLNVRIDRKKREQWKNDSVITGLIEQMTETIGEKGRIFVYENSSADPSVRVIAEGGDFGQINTIAMTIADTVKKRCGER